MANPGYGKRSAPGQPARTAETFAHLPAREGSIAAFIDRLPDGSDVSVKYLATVLTYGQQALGTALRKLEAAGHLRRGREHLVGSGGARWVTRTWWSRGARDNTWWAAYAAGALAEDTAPAVAPAQDGPVSSAGHAPPSAPVTSAQSPGRSRAYNVLAALGRRKAEVTLSAADCASLESLAAEWFALGASEEDILRALTDGLPTPVYRPVSLMRSRLIEKRPPEPLPEPEPVPRRLMRFLECSVCRAPGHAGALLDGRCAECRGVSAPVRGVLPPERFRAHVAEARSAARRPAESTSR